MSVGEAAELVEKLADLMANLDAYVTRRAKLEAAPIIAEAEKRAGERIRAAERLAERMGDLNKELGRRLGPLTRQADAAEDARSRLAAALGHRNHVGHFLPDLVTAAVEILTARQRGSEAR